MSLKFQLPAGTYVMTWELGGPSATKLAEARIDNRVWTVLAREETDHFGFAGVRLDQPLSYPYDGPPIWPATDEQAHTPRAFVAVASTDATMQARIGAQEVARLDREQLEDLRKSIDAVDGLAQASAQGAADALRSGGIPTWLKVAAGVGLVAIVIGAVRR